MKPVEERQEWDDVLDFWFPEGGSLNVDAPAHSTHWLWRMQGGADDAIVARFSNLTKQAADGALDHWALDPHGRLALIIILDQFSRSVWRDSARACTGCSSAVACDRGLFQWLLFLARDAVVPSGVWLVTGSLRRARPFAASRPPDRRSRGYRGGSSCPAAADLCIASQAGSRRPRNHCRGWPAPSSQCGSRPHINRCRGGIYRQRRIPASEGVSMKSSLLFVVK